VGPEGDTTITVTGNVEFKETINVSKKKGNYTDHEKKENYTFEVRVILRKSSLGLTVKIWIAIFWYMVLCILAGGYRYFGGILIFRLTSNTEFIKIIWDPLLKGFHCKKFKAGRLREM
jgi:hypothetical protein